MTSGGSMLAFDLRGRPRGRAPVRRRRAARPARLVARRPRDAGDAPGVDHPRRTDPEELADRGITHGLVRVSVGLEHADDLLADFAQALAALA